jgi:hypothetical protein
MNLTLKTAAAAFVLLIGGLLAHSALGQKMGKGGGCCDCCGACCDCCPVCVLECKEKEVEVVCWKCECEDFCLSGPCHLGCKHCENPCCGDGKGKNGAGCGRGCCLGCLCDFGFAWREECPGCPTHHHRKKLYKKIEKVKVPIYVWTVQSCCGKCEGKMQGAEIPVDADIPNPPAIESAKYKYRIQGQAPQTAAAEPVQLGNPRTAQPAMETIVR